MSPDKIIKYHSNIALWEGLISKKFLSYCKECKDKEIRSHGLLDLLGLCYSETLDNVTDSYDYYWFVKNKATNDSDDDYYYEDDIPFYKEDEVKAIYSEYCDFCEKRLKLFYSPEHGQATTHDHSSTEDWGEYFNNATINNKILADAIKSYSPLDIIFKKYSYDEYYIEPEQLLSFCNKEKRQKLLFNALISLIYNAILTDTETKLANQQDYSQILYRSLVQKIDGEYLDPYDLYVLLNDIGPYVCKSILLGFGLNQDDTGTIIAYLKTNEEGKVVDQIIKQREKGLLKADSKLIEFCIEFKTAQNENKFIDWCRRFSFKSDEIQVLNVGLMYLISKNHLFTQDIITSLKDSIYNPGIITADVPKWAKGNLTAIKVPEKGRFISGSTQFVIKQKLINILLDNWVNIDEGREEVERKLNYFFNDGQVFEMPLNPDSYTIKWGKAPKPQLIYILIRMLYNDKWDIDLERIVCLDEKTNLIVFNDNEIRDLPKEKGFPIMPIVNEVFSTEAKGFTQKKVAQQLKHLEPAQKLVKDIFECLKDEYKVKGKNED